MELTSQVPKSLWLVIKYLQTICTSGTYMLHKNLHRNMIELPLHLARSSAHVYLNVT